MRYCANKDCDRYDMPLPSDARSCPGCGSDWVHTDDVEPTTCSNCGENNAPALSECWVCGSSLQ